MDAIILKSGSLILQFWLHHDQFANNIKDVAQSDAKHWIKKDPSNQQWDVDAYYKKAQAGIENLRE